MGGVWVGDKGENFIRISLEILVLILLLVFCHRNYSWKIPAEISEFSVSFIFELIQGSNGLGLKKNNNNKLGDLENLRISVG